jgi:ribosome maturation factor RimP
VGRRDEIVEKVRAIAAPLAAAEGMELVDVELGSVGGRTTLRLYIDRDGGVSLDDCTNVSRAVSAALDVEDPVEGAYDLEVSSPGLDRPLRTPEHFLEFAGELVRVKAYGPIPELENRKTFVGPLRGFEDGSVLVEVDGHLFRVPLAQVAKAHLEPRFDGVEDRHQGPDAILTVDGRHIAADRSGLRAELKEARKRDRAEVWARRGSGEALCALFHSGSALLLLDDRDGRPAFTSRNPGPAGEGRVQFTRAGGEVEEVPQSWIVPSEDAARAVEHFYRTGQRPSFIRWHDEAQPGPK